MSEKLRDVYAKLDWADKHIVDLHSRVRAYSYSRPPAVSGEIEFDFDRNTVDWSGILPAVGFCRAALKIGAYE